MGAELSKRSKDEVTANVRKLGYRPATRRQSRHSPRSVSALNARGILLRMRAAAGKQATHVRSRSRAFRPLGIVKWAVRQALRAFGVPTAAMCELALRLSARRVGVALIYHGVSRQGGNPSRELVPAHAAKLFEEQMLHVSRRYQIVSAAEILEAVKRRKRGQRFPVAVTFDDDLDCHTSVTLPILRRVGLRGTFFLSGASLKAPSSFWWERLQRAFDARLPDLPEIVGSSRSLDTPEAIHNLASDVEAMEPHQRDLIASRLEDALGPDPRGSGMRAEAVRELVSAGMEVGFHTLRHDPLVAVAEENLERAMSEGKEMLENVAGTQLITIAYPHGRADERVAEAALAAGFTVGFTGDRSSVDPGSDPMLLGRLGPSYSSRGHFALQMVSRLLGDGRRPSGAAASPVRPTDIGSEP